jgi:hypothetical protein
VPAPGAPILTTALLSVFQVDYVRHVEVIAARVHRRLLVVVRRLLGQPTSKAAAQADAHELCIQWERYTRLLNDGKHPRVCLFRCLFSCL